jgi:hypothetical protein
MGTRARQVKGLSLTHWLQSFERLHGAEMTATLQARLPADLRGAIDHGLDPSEWYPLEWFRALCAAGREVTGEGLEMITRVARISAAAEFAGIHRLLVLFVSPQRLLRIAARLFGRYYSSGSVTTAPRGLAGAEVRWVDCAGFDENLWRDCWTATMVVIEMCGGKDVQLEPVAGGGDGDDHATVIFTWT